MFWTNILSNFVHIYEKLLRLLKNLSSQKNVNFYCGN